MDKIINSKVNKQAIYEIYRSCRLCGAGAGYKMPIIQNVLDIDGEEVELKQKIRECVQIEVSQDDKMPPLICELCVDKVNDFYEFMEMCRRTNKRTRHTLGLPIQTAKKGMTDTSDCILGVTEPVFVKKESETQRSSPRNVTMKGSKTKKSEVKVKVDIKSKQSKESNIRLIRSKRMRSPSPRSTRRSRSSNEDNLSLSKLKNPPKKAKPLPPPPKSILKKPVKPEVQPRPKRSREPPKPEIPQKRVKLSVKPAPKVQVPSPEHRCAICKQRHKSIQALLSHLRCHTVQFTSPKLACNSCCEWFETSDGAFAHHKRHKTKPMPYVCRGCKITYKTAHAYHQHCEDGLCVPWTEVPDVKCEACWRLFPTDVLRRRHRCPGEDGRPGGKCEKCNRTYSLRKNLIKHESTCTAKRKLNFKIDPELMKYVKPIQIRVSKCDPLLKSAISNHYDVSAVDEYYGLDSDSKYPYLRSRSLNLNSMVNIKSELDDFYCEEDYIHWDSDVSDDATDEETERRVHSLSTLSLKTLFSHKCLGRVPRKRRRVKTEKSVFDSLVNTDFDTDMSKNIDSIIDNLDIDDDNKNDDKESSKNIDDNDFEVDSDMTSVDIDTSKNITNNVEVDGAKNSVDPDTSKNIDNALDNEGTDDKNDVDDFDKIKDSVDASDDGDVQSNVNNDTESSCHNAKAKESNLVDSEKKINDDEDVTENSNIDATAEINSKLQNDEYRDEESKITESSDNLSNNDKETVENRDNEKDSSFVVNKIDTDKQNAEDKSICNDSVSESVENKDSDVSKDSIEKHVEDKIDDTENEPIDESCEINAEDKEVNESSEPTNTLDEEENVKHDISDTTKADESQTSDEIASEDLDSSKVEDESDKTENILNNIKESHTEDPITDENSITDENPKEIDKDEVMDNDNNYESKNGIDEESRTLNGDVDEKSDKLNMDDFHDAIETDIDDKKLMADLNEHIGENDDPYENTGGDEVDNDSERATEEATDSVIDEAKSANNSNDKISLEDLIPNQTSDTKSMDLDSISDDDFNFD